MIKVCFYGQYLQRETERKVKECAKICENLSESASLHILYVAKTPGKICTFPAVVYSGSVTYKCITISYPATFVTTPSVCALKTSSAFSDEYSPRGVLYCACLYTPSPGPGATVVGVPGPLPGAAGLYGRGGGLSSNCGRFRIF